MQMSAVELHLGPPRMLMRSFAYSNPAHQSLWSPGFVRYVNFMLMTHGGDSVMQMSVVELHLCPSMYANEVICIFIPRCRLCRTLVLMHMQILC